ncbi:sensor domain-containing phosphodiesterase [Robbsia sp. KACC 23696]|uniref:EAL domain-containing protein n=1 Tax=Robbsia sp. KACC 23696 TaxID=3149231 RepID=UPI00325AEB0D
MSDYTAKAKEQARLRALRATRILDTAFEPFYDRIVKLASRLFDVPTVLVSLVDEDRQWFKARLGFDCTETPRGISFCAHAILDPNVTVVLDASQDERFADNPLVINAPYIRFYAGAPLITHDGHVLGTLCIISANARKIFSTVHRSLLADLAGIVSTKLDSLRSVTYNDPPTGLPNLPRFIEDVSHDINSLTVELDSHIHAVLLDVYPFGDINGLIISLGFMSISEMAEISASRLKSVLPGNITLYRVGYARFSFRTALPIDQLYSVVETCLGVFAAPLVVRNSIPVYARPHAGIVLLRKSVDAFELSGQLVAITQEARLTGRKILFGNDEMLFGARRAFSIVNSIQSALAAKNELRLVYQPIVSLATGNCSAFECLLRWTHPSLGPISPSEFFPLVESTAFMACITDWVLATALNQLREWKDANINIKLALNLCANDILREDIVPSIYKMLTERELTGHDIEIEITETAAVKDIETARANVIAIKQIGVSIAIDDYGAGYCNLSLLQSIPVDAIKIDQSLVRGIGSNPRREAIIRSTIALAHELDYKVVLEGVETREVLNVAQSWGAEFAQGYFISRPMEASDVPSYVMSKNNFG